MPDNVLTPLLKGVASDNYFMSICATREDEAIGMAAGAWMGGMKSVVMMQTSGFALTAAGVLGAYSICGILAARITSLQRRVSSWMKALVSAGVPPPGKRCSAL